MAKYYDRYSRLKVDGTKHLICPYAKIEEHSTDLYITFDKSKMRLDSLSYKYYSSPDYAWLIMLANPSLGSLEYMIQDGVTMRIPYPLDTAIYRYETSVDDYLNNKVE